MSTVPVYIVLADSGEHKNQRLGMFFRVLDAEAFAATLASSDWSNVRLEPDDLPESDVHPAHQPLVSKSVAPKSGA